MDSIFCPTIGVYARTIARPMGECRLRAPKIVCRPCRASSTNNNDDDDDDDDDSILKDRMEEIMASAKDLKRQYFDLMKEASALTGKGDASRDIREELFRMSLQELQASLGVHDTSNEEADEDEEEFRIVEEYAAIIERGEDIPPPPKGMYHETKESAESFMERLRSGYQLFRDVVQGKIKAGNLMGKEEGEDELLTDIPEEKSRFVPDIPKRAMEMYTFGERILYILRRGYQMNSFKEPVELLDSYDLLSHDIVLETPWAQIRGADTIKRFCTAIDGLASFMKCSNLLMSYPKFKESDTHVMAKGTSDCMVYVLVPTWYTSYCMFTGKGHNRVSVKEQIDLGIEIPETLFPWNQTDTYLVESRSIQLLQSMEEFRAYLGVSGIISEKNWISYGTSNIAGDDDDISESSSEGEEDGKTLEDMTPDDAERILRSLFGDDFDAIAQQLPKKQSVPSNVDPEYQPIFEEDTPNQIKCSVTWTFETDLIAQKVSKITVEFNWINMGHVHEQDVFYILTVETGEYIHIINRKQN